MKNLNPVLREILTERWRQDTKWGEQNHGPEWWMQILMEEVGEAAKALLEANFSVLSKQIKTQSAWLRNYRKELIQVAAVAIAAIECFDRKKEKISSGKQKEE